MGADHTCARRRAHGASEDARKRADANPPCEMTTNRIPVTASTSRVRRFPYCPGHSRATNAPKRENSEDAMLNSQTITSGQDNEVFTRLESNVRSYCRGFSAIFTRA